MVRQAKTLQKKSRTHEITRIGMGFTVKSGSSGKQYFVRITKTSKGLGATCNCKWAQCRKWADKRSGCSHVIQVFNFLADEKAAKTVSAWKNQEDADRQHRPNFNIGDGITLTTRKQGS